MLEVSEDSSSSSSGGFHGRHCHRRHSPSSFGGDASVLVSAIAVFLFVYWIANFVVPGFISKDFIEPEASDRENIKD
ncbi:hypothetical protein KFK09_021140 [Dendrobium nobile]|uniref:Transmembrane protein n=1 Tax=Dendrobium nobile TaxID=94219 RepID=A0A8T3AQ98_DENNO|nr:hypothetical protein KFK09_021140 [Dendrobium nobile]